STQSAVVASILSLAHSAAVRVHAKAVETQSERACLESLGCDGYQGNFFSPALPRNLLSEFLKRQQMKPVSVSVEKTQPMSHQDEMLEIVPAKAPPPPEKSGPTYVISCTHCHQTYDAMEAQWCVCLTSDPTVVCPLCKKCFCKAPLDYRHNVWGAAPESFWD